jgi:hypothetical protein
MLATQKVPCQIADLKSVGLNAGFRIPKAWNPSASLGKSKGLAIRLPSGWEITEAGRQHLRNIGVTKLSPAALQVAVDLRAHLLKISNADTRAFVEEAVKCYEAELYRSAVVMSWLAAIHVLQNEIVTNHLSSFNAEAKRIDAKWKIAKNADDIGKMGEADFLERISYISVIGKNRKEELLKCLKTRNGCGHPNTLKIGPNAVASHIEILLLNVFEVFEH